MAQFEHQLLEQLTEQYRPLNAAFVSVLGAIQVGAFPTEWCSYALLTLGLGFIFVGGLKLRAKTLVAVMSVLFAHTLGLALMCQLNVVVSSILVLVILTQVLSLLGLKQGLPLLFVSAISAMLTFNAPQWFGLNTDLQNLTLIDTSRFSLSHQWLSAIGAFIYLAAIAGAHERVIHKHVVHQMQSLSRTAEILQNRLSLLEQDQYDLFRKIPSMTVVCDQDKNILVASDSFLRATGYILEDLVQKKFSQLFAVQDQESTRTWNEMLQRSGRANCQTKILNAKGEALHVNCAMSLSNLQSTQSAAYLLVIS